VIGTLLVAVPLQVSAADDTNKTQAATPDPNERVCEDIVQTGSRIATKRFCGTRAEWEAKQKQDRDVVDNAQRQAADPCHAILTHTGAPNCG
jgi:hypothetical protein